MGVKLFEELSREQGLTYTGKGPLFGWLNGFHITLSIVPSMMFRLQVYLPPQSTASGMDAGPETLQRSALLRAEVIRILESAAEAHYFTRVTSASNEQFVAIECRGKNKKAIKSLGSFLNAATSGIAALGIPATKICGHCGKPLESLEVPVQIKEDVFPMHDHCADEVTRPEAWTAEPKTGNVPLGILGALLGAVVGAIPWAVVFAMGYMVSLVGVFIGITVSKGYDLLHGRQGRVKITIVLLFVILSVALGQAAGTSYQLIQVYDELEAGLTSYEYMTVTKTEFLKIMWTQGLWEDAQAAREILSNFGMGLFFALLGCYAMLRQMLRDTAPKRPKRLSVPV